MVLPVEPAKPACTAMLLPSAIPMSARRTSAPVTTVPPRMSRSKSGILSYKLDKIIHYLNRLPHVFHRGRFIWMMAEAGFATHKEHGHRRDGGHRRRIMP